MKTKTRKYKTKNRKTRRGGFMGFIFGKSNNYKEFIDNAEKFKKESSTIFSDIKPEIDPSNMTINAIIAKAKELQAKENPVEKPVENPVQPPVKNPLNR
jgi:hypothetical protein